MTEANGIFAEFDDRDDRAPNHGRTKAAGATIMLGLVAMLGWSWYYQPPDLVRGQIKVASAVGTQPVATSVPGSVVEVYVQRGQTVRAGDALHRIDPTETRGRVQQLYAQLFSQLAKEIRLEAEKDGRYMPFSDLLQSRLSAGGTGAMVVQVLQSGVPDLGIGPATKLLEAEADVYEENARKRQADIDAHAVSRQQLTSELAGMQADLVSARDLYNNAAQGYALESSNSGNIRVSANVLTKQRDKLAAEGKVRALPSQINAKQSQIDGTVEADKQTNTKFRSEARAELSQVKAKISEIQPQLMSDEQKLKNTIVRSPVDGTVFEIKAYLGDVVEHGAKLATITPSNAELLAQAKISTEEIGTIAIGQSAEVWVAAFDHNLWGALSGTVASVSSDTTKDDHTGKTFYTVDIKLDGTSLHRKSGETVSVKTGAEGAALITTDRHRLLQKLLFPASDTLRLAFTESKN